MTKTTLLSRIARRLVERSGSDRRVDELAAHLDQLEANRALSVPDVASIALLALRTSVKGAAARFAKTYAVSLTIGVTIWWIAVFAGALAGLESAIEEAAGLEDFQFHGPALFQVFAVILVPAVLTYLFATRARNRRVLATS